MKLWCLTAFYQMGPLLDACFPLSAPNITPKWLLGPSPIFCPLPSSPCPTSSPRSWYWGHTLILSILLREAGHPVEPACLLGT